MKMAKKVEPESEPYGEVEVVDEAEEEAILLLLTLLALLLLLSMQCLADISILTAMQAGTCVL